VAKQASKKKSSFFHPLYWPEEVCLAPFAARKKFREEQIILGQ